jgi:hypothetical protein
MKLNKLKPTAIVRLLLFGLLGSLLADRGWGRPQEPSASDLISFLAHQSAGPDSLRWLVFSCGETLEDREDLAAARSLVKLGSSAVPDIEKALDAMEESGQPSDLTFNAGLILAAYARLKGAAAFPRLRSMVENPRLAFLESALDSSIALSFGLTSYVSFGPSTLVPSAPTASCGILEPRHALDQLLLAWEGDSLSLFRSSLGPDALTSLDALLKGGDWADMRDQFRHRRPAGGVAVGYRFGVPGRWSEPAMSIEEESQKGPLADSARPDIDAVFKNRVGGDCGRLRVKFSRASVVEGVPFPAKYLVNNPDLGDLLRLVAACASETN